MKGDDAIEKRAAEWLAAREARGFSASDQARFAAWCAADPRHARAFAEVERAWRVFDRLEQYPHPLDALAEPDLLRRRPARSWPAVGLALAAAAAIVVGVYFRGTSPVPVPPPQAAPVAEAGPRAMHLPDGSTVELNAGSEVRERFTPAQRRVQLVRGEAHFLVAKNPARPFVVEVGGVAVQAVGTAFNIRVQPDRVEVLVTEGRVQVDRSGSDSAVAGAVPPAILDAGQRVVVARSPDAAPAPVVVETMTPPAIDEALAWQAARLVFDATPLEEVVARVNHYTAGRAGAGRLVVHDPKLAALRFSGRIRADDLERLVGVLETHFGIAAERRPSGEIVLHARR